MHAIARGFLAIFLVLSAAPAATAQGASAADEILVVSEQDLPKMWTYKRGISPPFDSSKLREHGHACVTLGYVIEPDGRPSTIRVLKADPSGVFDATAIAALGKVRFKPGPANTSRTAVYSTITYTGFRSIGGDPARESRRVYARCAMEIVPPSSSTSPRTTNSSREVR